MRMIFALFAISILIVVMSGCIENNTKRIIVPTGPVVTDTPITTTLEETPVPTGPTVTDVPMVPTDIPEKVSTTQIYNIGQSVSSGDTKMTLNNIRYTNTIDEKKSVSKAGIGNKFLIIDLSIENMARDENLSYPGSQFIILDSDETIETIYEEDINASSNLIKYFNGKDISPGVKRQGELAFQVPENAKGLKLRFEYISESSEDVFLEFFTLDR